ncbi:hypothetical protein Tco_0924499 [Tanacetum coccineum]|uniref:Uncharacterized protein n=1 Tax=Tanacetum coccineum TaxID=301880 RepID=A0ABQ5D452_9ASTR
MKAKSWQTSFRTIHSDSALLLLHLCHGSTWGSSSILCKKMDQNYAELLWEGLHYALEHPSTQIPYPRFTKLIVGHYMTVFHLISHRAHDKYHNLEDDVMVKNIFNSGKDKDGVEMKIPSWMITDEMMLTDHYQMYDAVFGVDVPTTQSQPIESTQGTHRIISTPRSPNPETDEGESSAPRKSTVIRLRIPKRRSTRLTPPTPILTIDEANDIILQDTIQLSLNEQKSHDEIEAKKYVQKVEEHFIAEEIEKLVKGAENVENVEVDSSTLRKNDNPIVPGTRLEPGEEKESAEDDYELRRREKGKHVEESRSTPSPTKLDPLGLILLSSFFDELQGRYGYLFEHLKKRLMPGKKLNVLAQHLQEILEESLPTMVDD